MTPLCWGVKVSPIFRDRVRRLARELFLPPDYGPDWLMACMAWESGRSFSPHVTNGAGSGAVGLIQFMPATAKELGTNTASLAVMTAEEQLEYVARYFKRYTARLNLLSDVYMVILWPAAVGKPDSTILWDKSTRPVVYRQNAGLDGDHNGAITKAEAASKVHDLYVEGLRPSNVAV